MSLILGDWIGDLANLQHRLSSKQINSSSAFTVILHNITGDDNNTFWSTDTVSHHVPLNFSETVSCSDGPGWDRNITEHNISVGKSFEIIDLYKLNYCFLFYLAEPPSPPPLNLDFIFSPSSPLSPSAG